jgi:hypothetical protein
MVMVNSLFDEAFPDADMGDDEAEKATPRTEVETTTIQSRHGWNILTCWQKEWK